MTWEATFRHAGGSRTRPDGSVDESDRDYRVMRTGQGHDTVATTVSMFARRGTDGHTTNGIRATEIRAWATVMAEAIQAGITEMDRAKGRNQGPYATYIRALHKLEEATMLAVKACHMREWPRVVLDDDDGRRIAEGGGESSFRVEDIPDEFIEELARKYGSGTGPLEGLPDRPVERPGPPVVDEDGRETPLEVGEDGVLGRVEPGNAKGAD